MQTKFIEFIKRQGVRQVADLCGATPRAVESWRYGARRPRPEMANAIVAASAGELTLQDIYPPKVAA